MSAINVINGTCPKCKKETSFTIHSSFNAMFDLPLIKKLLTGELLIHECPWCGNKSCLVPPMLFNDMKFDCRFLQYVKNKKAYEEAMCRHESQLGSAPQLFDMISSFRSPRKEVTDDLDYFLSEISKATNIPVTFSSKNIRASKKE